MKRSIISLLLMGMFAAAATAALAQNVTADPKAGEPSKATDQKEMTNPSKDHAAGSNKSMHDKGDAAFKKADKDNDGTLDKQEAKAMPHVAKNFSAIDTDKDGTVSLEEVHTYMKGKHSAKN
jgi:hypothetical protein